MPVLRTLCLTVVRRMFVKEPGKPNASYGVAWFSFGSLHYTKKRAVNPPDFRTCLFPWALRQMQTSDLLLTVHNRSNSDTVMNGNIYFIVTIQNHIRKTVANAT